MGDTANVEVARYEALAADARYNRKYENPVEPSIEDIESLCARVEELNSSGTTDGFIDAQAELIDALLVALEVMARRHAGEVIA